MDQVHMITRTRHHGMMMVRCRWRRRILYEHRLRQAITIGPRASLPKVSLTKEVLFVSNRALLLLLTYSTTYAHSSIKGSKKTQKAYPQLIATEIQKEIQSWPPTSQLPSFGFSSWPFSAQTRSQSMLSPIISHPDPSNPIWSRVISRLIGRAYEANKKLCSILAYDDVVKLFELISLRLFPPDHLCPSKSVGVVHRLGLTRHVH